MLISLEGIKFHSPLGWYPEEQILGTDISVSIEVEILHADQTNDQLTRTINYETLYEIASVVSKKSFRLIETYCSEIINGIIHQHRPKRIKVKICKLHPPLSGQVEKACVEIERKF